jgi:uncharacterized membrane protein YhaH (DUF805 family)
MMFIFQSYQQYSIYIIVITFVRDFGPYDVMFMMCVCCYNRWHDTAFSGFWALLDNTGVPLDVEPTTTACRRSKK